MADEREESRGMVIQQVSHLLSHAERSVTEQVARAIIHEDCTVSHWRVLLLLSDGSAHGMSEIAEFALVPPPSLTRLIDRMVADNLVYRLPDAVDRRRVLIHATARGMRLHRRLAARIAHELEPMLTGIESPHLSDLAQLLGVLLGDRQSHIPSAARRSVG